MTRTRRSPWPRSRKRLDCCFARSAAIPVCASRPRPTPRPNREGVENPTSGVNKPAERGRQRRRAQHVALPERKNSLLSPFRAEMKLLEREGKTRQGLPPFCVTIDQEVYEYLLYLWQGRLRADPPSREFAATIVAAVYPSDRLNHPRCSMTDPRQLAEAVRAACIRAALDAYEEGGVLGLCAEGRWEYAISAMRRLSIDAFIAPSATGAVIEQDSEGNDGGRTGLVPGRPP